MHKVYPLPNITWEKSILPKPAKDLLAGMDHSQRGCSQIPQDQTEACP